MWADGFGTHMSSSWRACGRRLFAWLKRPVRFGAPVGAVRWPGIRCQRSAASIRLKLGLCVLAPKALVPVCGRDFHRDSEYAVRETTERHFCAAVLPASLSCKYSARSDCRPAAICLGAYTQEVAWSTSRFPGNFLSRCNPRKLALPYGAEFSSGLLPMPPFSAPETAIVGTFAGTLIRKASAFGGPLCGGGKMGDRTIHSLLRGG